MRNKIAIKIKTELQKEVLSLLEKQNKTMHCLFVQRLGANYNKHSTKQVGSHKIKADGPEAACRLFVE